MSAVFSVLDVYTLVYFLLNHGYR